MTKNGLQKLTHKELKIKTQTTQKSVMIAQMINVIEIGRENQRSSLNENKLRRKTNMADMKQRQHLNYRLKS